MLRNVRVKNGLLAGLPAADPRITVFKGIPYAAPPIGEMRWRAPQPAKNWNGTLEAYKFEKISMQKVPGLNLNDIYTREWNVDPEIEMSEDSLYLNVWTPAKSVCEKLPVFIWYHGGGFQEGATSEMQFDGERLARRGIVVVTVAYRLNAFGFLAHPEITKEYPNAPTNFGFLDQRLANIWVKENIVSFGGDPENITIGGQSAGGGSVLSQMTSPMTKDLFQRVIVDSGVRQLMYRPAMPSRTLREAEEAGVKFFELLGIKTLEEARKLDAFYVRDTVYANKLFFGPVEDGVFTTGNHHEQFMNAQCDVKPMLVGHTSTEFPAFPDVKTMEDLNIFAKGYFGKKNAAEFLRLVRSEKGCIDESLAKAKIPSFEYTCRLFGEMKAKTGNKTPMYYWVFDAEIPGWDNPGCFHSSDLWFFFETLAKCWRPFVGKHYDLSRQMCNYWANFIKNGDPNGLDADGSRMPEWKPYTVDNKCRMIFGETAYADYEKPSELVLFMLKNELEKRS